MATTPEIIDFWLTIASEHQRLEFKEGKTQFDNRKLYKYCVAIANEGGGNLILGIDDHPPRKVVGTAAFNKPIEMAEKLFTDIGFRVDIEEVFHPQGRVLVFHIPSRPRGTAYHLDGQYLMRSGQQLVPMSEDQLRRIFAEGAPDWLEEPSLRKLSAIEVIELLDVQTYFDLLKLTFPSTRSGVIEKLIQEKLILNEDGYYAIKRIGALLFAKRFENFDDVVRKAPRVIVYSGESKLDTKLTQIGQLGYASGFSRLVNFIMGQLPQNEVIEDAIRHEVKARPEIVIRELVANALIHQDFSVTGSSVAIEIYSNRIEVSNPGSPIVPVDRFIDGYQSRNERLANIMRRFGVCEEKGSGIDKVIDAVELYQLPAPIFRSDHNRTNVIIFGQREFEEMNRDDRIRACYQHCVLKWVMRQSMTNQSLRERFQLPKSKTSVVSQVIAVSIEAGKIKLDIEVGVARKFARYLPYWA